MKKILLSVMLASAMFSCQQPVQQETEKVVPAEAFVRVQGPDLI